MRRPVWKSTKSGWCPSVCEASGHRAALEDSSGTKKHICRPEPSKGRHSTLVGWAAFENAGPGRVGNACHYVAKQVGRRPARPCASGPDVGSESQRCTLTRAWCSVSRSLV